jgi:hypothetical protein
LVNNKRKWYCPHCSQTSSRRGNLKTHIERWHQGTGRPIREDERHSSYTASTATHYIPDMMIGLQNNNNNPHLNYRSYPHTFSAERRKIKEGKEVEEVSKKRDPISESLEFARKWVEWLRLYAELKNLSNQLWSTTPTFTDQLSVLQPQQLLQKTQYTNSNFTSPFGFRVYSCYRCLTNSLHRVFYPTNKEGTTIEDRHECNPHIITANEHRQNKSDIIKKLNDTSCELLKYGINGSTTNRDNYVICIELSDIPEEEEKEVLQLTNQQNPKTPISFWYQKEKCIKLNLDNEDGKYNNTNPHWAERAIEDGQTKLTDQELSEFLQLVKTATFALFKIKRKGDLHCYFMAITNVLLGPPTFN